MYMCRISTDWRMEYCLSGYSEMASQVHGQDFDPFAQPIDVEILMMARGGRKHGWLLMADSIIDTASTPTLSQIRARSTDSSPAIRQRASSSHIQMDTLKVISLLPIVD